MGLPRSPSCGLYQRTKIFLEERCQKRIDQGPWKSDRILAEKKGEGGKKPRRRGLYSRSIRQCIERPRLGILLPTKSHLIGLAFFARKGLTLLRRKLRVFRPWMNAGEGTRGSSKGVKQGVLRRVPPDEVCGGAMGFSPSGSTSSGLV